MYVRMSELLTAVSVNVKMQGLPLYTQDNAMSRLMQCFRLFTVVGGVSCDAAAAW